MRGTRRPRIRRHAPFQRGQVEVHVCGNFEGFATTHTRSSPNRRTKADFAKLLGSDDSTMLGTGCSAADRRFIQDKSELGSSVVYRRSRSHRDIRNRRSPAGELLRPNVGESRVRSAFHYVACGPRRGPQGDSSPRVVAVVDHRSSRQDNGCTIWRSIWAILLHQPGRPRRIPRLTRRTRRSSA